MTAEKARAAIDVEKQNRAEEKKEDAKADLQKRILKYLGRPGNEKGDTETGIAYGVGKSKPRDIQEAIEGLEKSNRIVFVAKIKKGNSTRSGWRLNGDLDDEDEGDELANGHVEKDVEGQTHGVE
jgi:hypothetical protein